MANFQPLPSFPGQPSQAQAQQDAPDYAPWARRAGAYLIDLVLGVGLATAIAIATGHHTPFSVLHFHLVSGKEQLQPIGSKLVFFDAAAAGVQLLYTIGFLASRWQATPGMRLLGIFIARQADHGTVGVGRAAGRTLLFFGVSALVQALLRVAASLLVLVDLLWPLWDARNQTLHDKVARTVVLRKRTGH